jgi:hypothetical protein
MAAPRYGIVLLLLAVLSLSGCMSLEERKKDAALDTTLSHYRTAMRWGHWDTLFSYRDASAPQAPDIKTENIRVTAYEIRQPPVPISDEQVSQVVEIQYVVEDQQRLRKVLDKQDWRHDKENNQWRLHSAFPDFR